MPTLSSRPVAFPSSTEADPTRAPRSLGLSRNPSTASLPDADTPTSPRTAPKLTLPLRSGASFAMANLGLGSNTDKNKNKRGRADSIDAAPRLKRGRNDSSASLAEEFARAGERPRVRARVGSITADAQAKVEFARPRVASTASLRTLRPAMSTETLREPRPRNDSGASLIPRPRARVDSGASVCSIDLALGAPSTGRPRASTDASALSRRASRASLSLMSGVGSKAAAVVDLDLTAPEVSISRTLRRKSSSLDLRGTGAPLPPMPSTPVKKAPMSPLKLALQDTTPAPLPSARLPSKQPMPLNGGLQADATDSSADGGLPTKFARAQTERFRLEMLTLEQKHTTFWDADTNTFYLYRAYLLLRDMDPLPAEDLPLPHITDVALSCSTIHQTFQTSYSAQQLHRTEVERHFDIAQGICVEPFWKRAQPPPTYSYTYDEEGEVVGRVEREAKAGSRGWSTRFWVPIPMGMFGTTEARAFEIRARVRVRVQGEGGKGECVEFGARMETSVSSLRLESM